MTTNESFAQTIIAAWQGKLELSGLIDAASALEAGGLRPLAAVLYKTWLARNESPMAHVVQFNLGATLSLEKDYAASEAAYR